MKLWQKVICGLILGILFGLFANEYVYYIKPFGDIFLKLIKMIITPLVFFSLISGVTSISNADNLGRIGIKSVLAFTITTLFAVVFGLIVALVFKPGNGIKVDLTSGALSGLSSATNLAINHVSSEKFNALEFIFQFIPSNIFEAFAQGNILQIVFCALFIGTTIVSIGEKGKIVKDFCDNVAQIIIKMIGYIMNLSPIGAFALTAWVVGTQGIDIMLSLSRLMFAVIMAMFFQYLIFGILIYIFCRISPFPFYRKSFEYQIMAFSTSSSKATLPVTMEVCKNNLGVSSNLTSFLLPFGASINMDGLAINLSLTAIFFAQLLGIDLVFSDYIIIVITSTLGSIGGAGIPGASLIMLPMVLSSVNLPIEGVAILAGIDRILDMFRTIINITGDATITLIIADSEKALDRKKYYA